MLRDLPKLVSLAYGLLAISLTAACSKPVFQSEEFLDEIERNIKLPDRSLTIAEYSRYYALNKSNQIEAVYIVHDRNFVSDVRKMCKSQSIDKFPCGPKRGQVALVGAGNRRWLAKADELPMAHGGGCGVIRFTYDLDRRALSDLQCNGEY